MLGSRPRTVTLASYKAAVGPALRVESLARARDVYVCHGSLLCEAGFYSTPAILASLARGLRGTRATPPRVSAEETVGLHDSAGVNGLRTLHEVGTRALVDIRPTTLLSWLPASRRLSAFAALATAARRPERFFCRLFDLYADVSLALMAAIPGDTLLAANERSLGCCPALAAARFERGRSITIVQHGNPICDYLPTMAHLYLCRSDRWHRYLKGGGAVPRAERTTDFAPAQNMHWSPASRRAVLILHNIGYMEPALDYAALTADVAAACSRAGRTLEVLTHPASRETFGLPEIDRSQPVAASLFIGYRSTMLDQLGSEVPRVSLLDYWPRFFLEEGADADIADFLSRIRTSLS